mmetsp:Transcript_51157/g.128456  ORF Transcript_51157/g.128456 Transcript_51157/m.128456 type:complete len:89 (-) Transcript_51157:1780-2046(-)
MWRRLPEIVSNAMVATDRLSADSVQQGYVGDCAFLSSLVALANCEEKGRLPLVKQVSTRKRDRTVQSPFSVQKASTCGSSSSMVVRGR